MDLKYYKSHYCSDIENVENYEKAKADNFVGWVCHHRLETHNSDGEKRLVDISAVELIALGMYYNRPASELIFMKRSEHSSLHKPSEETRNKISEAKKGKCTGKNNSMYGRRHSAESIQKMSDAKKGKRASEETRKKLAESHKGKHFTAEHKKKLSEAHKGGMHWFNNGKINILAKECPDGFTPGMLKRK